MIKSLRKKNQSKTCDNCALMTFHLCGDGLLHRYCTALSLHISDYEHQAVCSNHKTISYSGGVR